MLGKGTRRVLSFALLTDSKNQTSRAFGTRRELLNRNSFKKPLLAASTPYSRQDASIQTTPVLNGTPKTLPPKCGPKNCSVPRPNVFLDCKARATPKWTGCDKICMPCCCPSFNPPDCDSVELRINNCKRLEYRIPSFSECRKTSHSFAKIMKECCMRETTCPELGLDELVEPMISTKVRQNMALGRKMKSK